MAEPGVVKPLCGWGWGEDGNLVVSLVQGECGALGRNMITRLCQQLYSKLCCFPV